MCAEGELQCRHRHQWLPDPDVRHRSACNCRRSGVCSSRDSSSSDVKDGAATSGEPTSRSQGAARLSHQALRA